MEPVTILTFNEPEQAQTACKHLEDAGLHPAIDDERGRQSRWLVSEHFAGIRVQVDKHEYERAEELLDQWVASNPDILRGSIHCPECGSSEVEYPQYNRKFKLEPAVIALLSRVGLFEKKFYCHHCHFTWGLSDKVEEPTDILGWPEKRRQHRERHVETTPRHWSPPSSNVGATCSIAKARGNRVVLSRMSTVAELLRTAREEQKLNIYQVAEITKIKTDHIRALEAGQYDAFSAPVYIRGFVRTYAKALKLDVTKVSATLDSELARTEKFSEPPPLGDRPRGALDFVMLQLSKLNWRVFGTGLTVAVVLLVLFFALRGGCGRKSDPLKKLGPGLYKPTNTTGELLPLPERKR